MDYRINFPNLGIYLEHVGKTISIGNFTIAYYGIMIAIGMLLGVGAVTLRARETKQNTDQYFDIAMVALIAGIVGARIYYVLFSWDLYKDDLLSILNIRQGGLAIYGGIIAGLIAILIVSRIKGMKPLVVLDTVVIGLPIGQILGRWGNFFNREAFGEYTNSLFAMQLPTSAVRSGEITEQMWEHAQIIDGITMIQVSPTFLYEGMWNCAVLLILFLIRNKTKFDGQLFFTYGLGYALGRIWIESLRTDQLLVPGTTVPVSIVVSVIGAVVAITFMIKQFYQSKSVVRSE